MLRNCQLALQASEDREVDDILRKLYPEWDEEESERKVTDSAMAITIEGKPLLLPSKEEEQKSELIGAKPKPEKQKLVNIHN